METTSSSSMWHRRAYLSDNLRKKLTDATGLPPKEAILKLFEEEVTLLSIAKRLGVNRTSLYQAMVYLEIDRPAYNQSEHMREWFKGQPAEKGIQLTQRAHQAVKGVKKTDEQKVKVALRKQAAAKLSKGESVVVSLLNTAGVENIPLMAIHFFNIDIAIPHLKIALEINGGNWHTLPSKTSEDDRKREYLEAIGWKVIYFWGNPEQIGKAAQEFIETIQRS